MKKRLLVLLIIMLLPIKLFALSGSVNISCQTTTLELNKTYTCSLKGYTSEEVSALTAKLSSSSNLTISNIQTASIWQGNGSGGSIDLYTDINKNGNFSIATFNIKLTNKNASTITVNSIRFSDANFKDHSIASKTISFSVKQEVTATTTTKKAQIETTTKTTTKEKETITTNKESKKDNNTKLKKLNITNVNFNFDSNKNNYIINASKDVKEVSITAQAESDKAKVVGPDKLKLNPGENKVIIKVIAEDGSTSEYKIIINKLERKLSSNSLLEELNISDINFDFDSNVKTYDLGTIKKDKLDIHYLTEDEKAKVYVYGNNNISKNDVIVIKVVAEDSSVSEYILYVNNLSKDKGIILLLTTIAIVLLASIILVVIKKKKN